jgi:hypothetical protein
LRYEAASLQTGTNQELQFFNLRTLSIIIGLTLSSPTLNGGARMSHSFKGHKSLGKKERIS